MQVLKRGIIPEYICTCEECGSTFTYKKVDTEPSLAFPNDMGHVDCPVCGVRNTVSYDRINKREPDAMMEAIKKSHGAD